MRKQRLYLLIALFLSLILAGCLAVEVTPEVETSGTATVYHYWNNYDFLNKNSLLKVDAKAGQTLRIEFSSVIRQGSLALSVASPTGKIVSKMKAETGGDQSIDVPISDDGQYSIFIRARNTSGSFDLQYRLEE